MKDLDWGVTNTKGVHNKYEDLFSDAPSEAAHGGDDWHDSAKIMKGKVKDHQRHLAFGKHWKLLRVVYSVGIL